MLDNIKMLELLLRNKEVEIKEGVFVCCEKQIIHLDMYLKDNNVVIEFSSPFTYLHIRSFSAKRLLNIVKPRIESITITPNSYILKLSTLGNYEIER